MEISQIELIAYYTSKLEKVIAMWKDDELRGEDYIKYAREGLEAVKNGRGW